MAVYRPKYKDATGKMIESPTLWIDVRCKKVKGGRIRQPIISIADVGKKAAYKAATDAYCALKVRVRAPDFDPAELEQRPESKAQGVTFARAVELYLEHRYAQGRIEASYPRLKEWLPVFGDRPVATITTDEIEAQLSAWTTDRKLGAASRNRILAAIASLLSYCYGRRWIDAHPTERGRIPRLAEDNARTRWLRPTEIEKIIAAANALAAELKGTGNHVVSDQGKRRWLTETFPALFRFGCMTGMRVSEVCGLRRSSYQTDANGLAFAVTEKPTKNRTFLRWPLEGAALTIVEAQLGVIPDKPNAYLFPGPWGEGSRASVNRSFPGIVKKAGLVYGRDDAEGIVWHTTRHTMASLALNNGVPEPVVMKLGNWKSRALVARYAHLADETMREAAGTLASIVSGHGPAKNRSKSGQRTVTVKSASAKSASKSHLSPTA